MQTAAATCLMLLASAFSLGCQATDRSTDGASTGTGTGEGTRDEASAASGLEGEWRLTAIRGAPVELPGAQRPPTLRIAEGREVGGFGGVNQWGSTLDLARLDGGEFGLGPVTSTLMAGPREAMELEDRYFDALGAVRRFDGAALAGGELVLRDESGAELLRFARGR
ncbi:MAG TPA: META domain-containing protein [Phycisphaerales bacterium]|nr:META domain-containing protein [Phycisphaerales bacterium]